jgi:hypothetical protein
MLRGRDTNGHGWAQVPFAVPWGEAVVVYVYSDFDCERHCASDGQLRRVCRGFLRGPISAHLDAKKRRWHSPDPSVGAKLECYYRCTLGGPFSELSRPRPAAAVAAAAAAKLPEATCAAARSLTIDFIDRVLTGSTTTYRELLVSRWAASVAAAWLPETTPSPTPTVTKVLRKGALNQPLSVRYLHSQLERAAARAPAGQWLSPDAPLDASTLLVDIVVSTTLGLWSTPPATIDPTARTTLLASTPAAMFAATLAGSRSMVLHRVVRSFLAGISAAVGPVTRWAVTRPALCVSVPVPALAYRGIFRRVMSTSPTPTLGAPLTLSASVLSASGALALSAVTSGATAKRAKLAGSALSASDRGAIAAHCRRRPLAAIVPLDAAEWDQQQALPSVTIHLCSGCASWRPTPAVAPAAKRRAPRGVVVDLHRPGTLTCGGCGSTAISAHRLNGRCIMADDPWRLCGICGALSLLSRLVPYAATMVCPGCKPTPLPPCLVCGCAAASTTTCLSGGRFTLVGLCVTHDVGADEVPVSLTASGLSTYIAHRGPASRQARRARR